MYHVQRRGVIGNGACRQSGQERSAPIVTAKIGGPTGIEGRLLSSHPHVETGDGWLHVSLILEPRGDSGVALACWRVIRGRVFLLMAALHAVRRRRGDSEALLWFDLVSLVGLGER